MKGAFLYVNAGKGHYTPAKALCDSFIRSGHDAVLEDLFVVFNTPFWEKFCILDWRFLLHHPHIEPYSHAITDNRLSFFLIRWQGLMRKHYEGFLRWYEKEKPDFIVSTNFIGGVFLPDACEKAGIKIPIYQYCADVFFTPKTGINNKLAKMYFSSDIGIEDGRRKKQREETLSLLPFPLHDNFEFYKKVSKREARKILGLKDKFTILYNLGGEGIGSTSILRSMAKEGLDVQVVTIGGKSNSTKKALDRVKEEFPDFDLIEAGFVSNIEVYLNACDLQIGKAGANSLMEAVYMRVPCLVTSVLFAFRRSLIFFDRYKTGWGADKKKEQMEIIRDLVSNPERLEEIEKNFEKIPYVFSSERARDQIIKDTEEFYRQ